MFSFIQHMWEKKMLKKWNKLCPYSQKCIHLRINNCNFEPISLQGCMCGNVLAKRGWAVMYIELWVKVDLTRTEV